MALLLDQLIYTSFSGVGLRVLVSAQVPKQIQQAFMQKVVYQHWDSDNPPKFGYRAAYIHEVTQGHTLFGWLYYDEVDDLGHSHVPYFACYYLTELLHAMRLEDIFTCLQKGPVALIDRHSLPAALETIIVPDLWSYQPARIGVAIPASVRDRSYITLKQNQLLDLFIPVNEWGAVIDLTQNYKQPTPQPSTKKTATPTPQVPFVQEATSVNKSVLIGMGIGVASVALIVGSYYSRRSPAPTQLQQASTPSKNTSLGNITLASTLTGHSDAVWCVALSPDGQTLVSGSADKTIKAWELDTGQLRRTVAGHSDTVRSVTFSPNGQILVSGSGDKTIKLWNVQTGELVRTLTGHFGPVWSVAFSSDGQTIVSGGEDNTIKIWNLSTGELVRTLTGHSSQIFSVALSSDGQTIVSGSKDNTIKIWNLSTGELVRTLTGHSDTVRAVTISPDAKKIASGSWDTTIKIWNLQTGEQISTLRGHTDRVVAIAFSADGQTLTSASVDKTVKIWSLQTRKLLRDLSGHSDWVLSVTTSPSGQTIVSSSRDKTIKIWRL